MVLAWENFQRFLFVFVQFVVVAVVHLSSFVNAFHFVSSFDFQATLPCHRHSTLVSHTREGLHQLWDPPQLLLIAFFLSITSSMVLSRRFLPTGVFYLKLLPNIFGKFPTFWHSLLLSRFWLEPAVTFLKVVTDPAHMFVWFTVIQNLLYILSLYLCMSILQEFLLVVKTLIRLAATLFSSIENKKQQPN